MLTHAVQVPHGYVVRGTGMHPCQLVLLSESHPPKVSCIRVPISMCVCSPRSPHQPGHTPLPLHVLDGLWQLCLLGFWQQERGTGSQQGGTPISELGQRQPYSIQQGRQGGQRAPEPAHQCSESHPRLSVQRERGQRVLLRGSCLCGLMPHEDFPVAVC